MCCKRVGHHLSQTRPDVSLFSMFRDVIAVTYRWSGQARKATMHQLRKSTQLALPVRNTLTAVLAILHFSAVHLSIKHFVFPPVALLPHPRDGRWLLRPLWAAAAPILICRRRKRMGGNQPATQSHAPAEALSESDSATHAAITRCLVLGLLQRIVEQTRGIAPMNLS